MRIQDTHIPEILHILAVCGVSSFNVMIRRNGLVLFWSGGMKPDEVRVARECLVEYLRSVE